MNNKSPKMMQRYGTADSYSTPVGNSIISFPTLRFFSSIIAGPLLWLWGKARAGKCDDYVWVEGSAWVGDILEDLGGQIHIEGMDNLRALREPAVIVANHMSTLETFLLPAMIRPYQPITFVVKKSLTTMPVFGPIMRSRNPVVVNRTNPRDDLAEVLQSGTDRLKAGVSVIVFPQHTRSLHFDPGQFNTIGVKLALKAGVQILPVALKTDTWGQGKRVKELGKVRPELPARFSFGKTLRPAGRGKEEHGQICKFIAKTLERWEELDGQ